MKLVFSLTDTEANIQKKILTAINQEISKIFKAKNVLKNIQDLVTNAILQSPEYQSLVGGPLQGELGVPDPIRRVTELLNIWINNTRVTFTKPNISGKTIKGQLKIEMIKSDLSDVLGSDLAFVIDAYSGKSIHWLEWLSLAGDKTIIKNYDVVFGPNKRSRTGIAVMRQIPGGRWKVPSQFAGTINNNWITRSIDSIESKIQETLQQAFI